MIIIMALVSFGAFYFLCKLATWGDRENYKEFVRNNPDTLHLVRCKGGGYVLKKGAKTVNL